MSQFGFMNQSGTGSNLERAGAPRPRKRSSAGGFRAEGKGYVGEPVEEDVHYERGS